MKMVALCGIHDANVSLYDSTSGFFRYIKKERVTNIKHDGLVEKDSFLKDILHSYNFYPDMVILDDDVRGPHEFSLYGIYNQNDILKNRKKIIQAFNESFGKRVPIFWVSHHYAHILSSFPLQSQFEYGISADGRSPGGISVLVMENPFDLKLSEVLYLQLHKTSSFGYAMKKVARIANINANHPSDLAGKVMGLYAYGCSDEVIVNKWKKQNECTYRALKDLLELPIDNIENYVATAHEMWSIAMIDLFTDYVQNSSSSVCFSGGAAQNTVTNAILSSLYPNLKIVPHCYDGGLSIGAIAFLCLYHNEPLPNLPNYPYLQRDIIIEQPTESTILRAAELLAEGKIIGWHQGAGEVGPRALGNRSILMNPSIDDCKNILNQKVKHREHWRPFAPSILEEEVSEWFECTGAKPYMMEAVQTKEEKKHLIKGVVHKDGTARIQTVNQQQNPVFYKLLQYFFKITGLPLVLNTSLNVGGKPISGSMEASLEVLRETELDCLFIGNKILL